MISRLFFTLTIAVAMAVAPFSMPAGEAMAAPAPHHGQVMAGQMAADHCSDEPQQKRGDESDKPCCVAGCFALATLDVPAGAVAGLQAARERPSPDSFRRGFLGEIATPPPRFA